MLRKLSLRNTEVTDVSMRYITQHLPQLTSLAVSGCWKLTDAGMDKKTLAFDTITSALYLSLIHI